MTTIATVVYVLALLAEFVILVGVINLLISDLRRERKPELYDCHGGCGVV